MKSYPHNVRLVYFAFTHKHTPVGRTVGKSGKEEGKDECACVFTHSSGGSNGKVITSPKREGTYEIVSLGFCCIFLSCSCYVGVVFQFYPYMCVCLKKYVCFTCGSSMLLKMVKTNSL